MTWALKVSPQVWGGSGDYPHQWTENPARASEYGRACGVRGCRGVLRRDVSHCVLGGVMMRDKIGNVAYEALAKHTV